MKTLKRMMNPNRKHEKGFTLIELLIVVGILAVIAAVAIPNLTKFMGAGKEESYDSDKQVLQTAVGAFYAEYGVYPTQDGAKQTGGVAPDATDTVVFGPGTGWTDALTAEVSSGGINLPVTSTASCTAGDRVLIGNASGGMEIVTISAIPDGTNLTVNALALNHASGEAVIQMGLVTNGFLTEAAGSSSEDNDNGNGEGHYTWFVNDSGAINSAYNATSALGATAYGTLGYQTDVYP